MRMDVMTLWQWVNFFEYDVTVETISFIICTQYQPAKNFQIPKVSLNKYAISSILKTLLL